jgi:aspartate aminotransferase-like enzyme
MQLRIPGPTPCPDEVLKAIGRQMINHRGKEFA